MIQKDISPCIVCQYVYRLAVLCGAELVAMLYQHYCTMGTVSPGGKAARE